MESLKKLRDAKYNDLLREAPRQLAIWGSLCSIVSHIKEFQGSHGKAMTTRRNREK